MILLALALAVHAANEPRAPDGLSNLGVAPVTLDAALAEL